MEKQSRLEQLNINLDAIPDGKIKEAILFLFNLIEELSATVGQLQQENQGLRDENNRLKGEQGKPSIKANKKKDTKDISSEKERKRETSQWKKNTKKDKIKTNRTETCKVDKESLPADAEFKGYESVVVQDLKIESDNIEFKKEVYYSASQKKTYMGKLPTGYEGEFGPTIKALAIIMKNVCNMSEPNILDFLHNFKVQISAGTLSNILIKDKEQFHQEKNEIYKAGLEASAYQQIDETSARVNGRNYHTHIVCNPFYSAYFTTEKKDRLTVLEILRNGTELKYCLNQETFRLFEQLKVAKKHMNKLKKLESDKEYLKDELEALFCQHLISLNERVKVRILEASAIASYHKGLEYPVVKVLLCDDAPQFKILTEELALCWIHEGRHYKKLAPVVPNNVKKLEEFIERYWNYYRKLLDYKSSPLPETATLLSAEFDDLFSTQTGYQPLDDRISKTKQKKASLLLVLKHPELPLHNNEAELGARAQVRKRDVSLHTITVEGTKANDTFLTIVQTCKKLGISAYEYIFDRINKSFKLPSLAQIIKAKKREYAIEICGP